MYLFGARLRAKRGMGVEAAAYVTNARDHVSKVSETPFWAWSVAGGDDLGTFALSARVDSFEHYMTTNAAVNADPGFHELTKTSYDIFDGPTQTSFSQVMAVAGELGETAAPLVVVTVATMAPGRQGSAMAWGIEVLNHVVDEHGGSGMFTTSPIGAINDISWIQNFNTPGEIDDLNKALQSDTRYVELLGEGRDLMVAGSSRRMILAKLP